MSMTAAMLRTHPATAKADTGALANAIDLLLECAAACTACADACLAEPGVEVLRQCIRLNLDCADLCTATARVLSRGAEADTSSLVEACRRVIRNCQDECARHAEMHEHCRICAQACHDAVRALNGVHQ
jgi:hypothetical protein